MEVGCIRVLADAALRALIISFQRGLPGHLYRYWQSHRSRLDDVEQRAQPGELVQIAIGQGDVGELEAIHRLFTGSAYYRSMGLLQFQYAVHCAAVSGTVSSLEWLHSSTRDGIECDPEAAHIAAVNGNQDALRWLLHHCPACTEKFHEDTVLVAAAHDHAGVIELLLEDRPQLVISRTILSHSIEAGALLVVQLLHERFFKSNGCRDCKGIGDKAASAGQLAVVEYLHSNCPRGFSSDAMDWAAANGHLAVVEFLHRNRREGCTVYAMDQAAAQGWLRVVEFLHSNRSEGCTLYAMDGAARRGHFDVLRFLHANRSEGCSAWALAEAAEKGHLDVVEFLHAHKQGLDWEESALFRSARNGHLAVVQFLCENTRVGDRVFDALRGAKSFRHEAVVQYLNQQIRRLLELKESEQREKLRRQKHAKGRKKRSK